MSETPVLLGTPTDAELSLQLTRSVWQPPRRAWFALLAISGLGALGLFSLIAYTFAEGVGLWGNNIPVAWAFAIINFVWWIGIGHAGTFISAILLLLEQSWRTSINRFAEAMTLFAVVQAGIFPVIHLGRPWFAYWLVPYPATMEIWPNFKSALPWDAAAVSTYFLVSLMFWYLGLIPDLAVVRDSAPGIWRRRIYGVFALGWRGSVRHLRHYRIAYGILAGLATPLVLSVHSVVSSDFAITILPGWHSTLFPPYFVAGAIFSGFAMVTTLMVPIRRFFALENVITVRHLDNVAKFTLLTGLIVDFSYLCEFYVAWYSGKAPEEYTFFHAFLAGPNAGVFWTAMVCNVLVPQLYWFPAMRRHPLATLCVAILINVGMWSERFFLIVLSLQRDYSVSAWRAYSPTWVDWGIFAGTLGFFVFLFLLFIKFVPFVPVSEVKELARELAEEGHA
ncbi:MAG TPA: NrfD/PsrC family molybdoenzyme membrane anchor subunit [Polyangiaceae bacterium]|nr:NrfD/PsrC family molybdoenzyme membrane anchor subunit [Polyangiaceae bacterium]